MFYRSKTCIYSYFKLYYSFLSNIAVSVRYCGKQIAVPPGLKKLNAFSLVAIALLLLRFWICCNYTHFKEKSAVLRFFTKKNKYSKFGAIQRKL